MSNPSKQKGTKGETELLRLLAARGIIVRRREAGARTDLRRDGNATAIRSLATRPDHGQWLFTMDFNTFCDLIRGFDEVTEENGTLPLSLDIEVKRWTRFAHHTLFTQEMAA